MNLGYSMTLPNTHELYARLLRQFATHLASIHALDCQRLDVGFLPQHAAAVATQVRQDSSMPSMADSAPDEGRILDALRSAWPIGQQNQSVLLHGDYWPSNTIWQDERLAAIIDWEDAAIGDPLADLANSRLEILWAGGFDAMTSYTQQYHTLRPIDRTNLPYWDLYAALRPVRNMAGLGA